MAFPKFLSAAKASAFTVVAEGDNATAAGFIITEDQANATEAAFTAAEDAAGISKTTITSLTTERDAAIGKEKTAADKVAGLNATIATLTKERDAANALVVEYGGKTGEPKTTAKEEDEFEPKNKLALDSFDTYAASMGVPRVIKKDK